MFSRKFQILCREIVKNSLTLIIVDSKHCANLTWMQVLQAIKHLIFFFRCVKALRFLDFDFVVLRQSHNKNKEANKSYPHTHTHIHTSGDRQTTRQFFFFFFVRIRLGVDLRGGSNQRGRCHIFPEIYSLGRRGHRFFLTYVKNATRHARWTKFGRGWGGG